MRNETFQVITRTTINLDEVFGFKIVVKMIGIDGTLHLVDYNL